MIGILTHAIKKEARMLISRSAKENQSAFKAKRFIPRVVTRAKCSLPNDVVKVYSFLVYKARDQRPVPPCPDRQKDRVGAREIREADGECKGSPQTLGRAD